MNRRDFLKTSLAGAGVAAGVVAGSAAAADAKPATEAKAVLKLSSQENKVPGKDLAEKVRKLQEWGGAGIEIEHY
jgi:secreted PhoX family phosphatase